MNMPDAVPLRCSMRRQTLNDMLSRSIVQHSNIRDGNLMTSLTRTHFTLVLTVVHQGVRPDTVVQPGDDPVALYHSTKADSLSPRRCGSSFIS